MSAAIRTPASHDPTDAPIGFPDTIFSSEDGMRLHVLMDKLSDSFTIVGMDDFVEPL